MSEFCWPVRVYYEDTDAGGVVYHASYVRYFERGRTEWLRSLGYTQIRLAEEDNVLFSVVTLHVDYLKPARLDDLLAVTTRAAVSGGASVQFEQALQGEGGAELARATVRVACVDAHSFKPRRLPADLRKRII